MSPYGKVWSALVAVRLADAVVGVFDEDDPLVAVLDVLLGLVVLVPPDAEADGMVRWVLCVWKARTPATPAAVPPRTSW
ncbi:MAG TPA: hypothetical protein VNF71_01710 [Acidimicrobiales bacterium]|nr:hypothetical protein [Acidimicrobiales bacterium]